MLPFAVSQGHTAAAELDIGNSAFLATESYAKVCLACDLDLHTMLIVNLPIISSGNEVMYRATSALLKFVNLQPESESPAILHVLAVDLFVPIDVIRVAPN